MTDAMQAAYEAAIAQALARSLETGKPAAVHFLSDAIGKPGLLTYASDRAEFLDMLRDAE